MAMKVLVVTAYTAAAEPRAVRNAIAARQAFPKAEIVFVDRVARGDSVSDPAAFADNAIQRATLPFDTKASAPLKRTINLLKSLLARLLFRTKGRVSEALFGPTAIGLSDEVARHRPDLIIAHTVPTLPAALAHSRKTGSPLIFDVFEYYSEMGDSQTTLESAATKVLEADAYGHTSLLLTTSEALADVLRSEYSARNILVSLNVPPLEPAPRRAKRRRLKLYWRNSQVALSQRGLEDVLEAMPDLPAQVELFIQGRASGDLDRIQAIARRLGVLERVHILPAFAVGGAVKAAGAYDIGLCLERPGPRNHELTISNKFFDYHMAGLAVVSSDMPSLTTALKRSGGGLAYRAGSAKDLGRAIRTLHADPALLESHRSAARRFAEERGNLEFELKQVSAAFRKTLTSKVTEW